MERVTGIGGVFIKAKNPKELAGWYQKHLGIAFGDNSYYTFKWDNQNDPGQPGNTVFSFFKKDSSYFNPSASPFMINFRVKDLVSLLNVLKQEAVPIEGEMNEGEYGKFCWIMDPEGNKIELWEPLGAL
jgi:predicted enzyme related to lactoylglutathione lyase